MKSLKIGGYVIGGILVGLAAAMAVTNPGQAAYEDYAAKQLTAYLKSNACTQAPNVLGNLLQNQCAQLLDKNQSQIRRLIANGTDRQNFLFLSIYKTDLSISQLLPSYHFETVGAFQTLHTYKAERR
jgi:hypothetical protein